MKDVDIIIPSKGLLNLAPLIASFRYLPEHGLDPRIHLILEGNSWPTAINSGIAESKHDIIICDDDVVLLPDTFKDFLTHFEEADIFGFKLLFPNRTLQHAGGFIKDGHIGHRGFGEHEDTYNEVEQVDHCTASLLYIKRKVIDRLGGMATDYKGYQFEDVDFNIRAKRKGFKILYIPNKAFHFESQTKKQDPEFYAKMNINYEDLKRRFNLQ